MTVGLHLTAKPLRRLMVGAVLASIACSPGAEPAEGADLATAWDPWVVASTPSVVIGALDTPDDALASVTHARRISDGYVVSTNVPIGIRTFDEDGHFRAWIGRQGEGPGEFRSVTGLWVTGGDTIVAVDDFQQRVNWLGSSGERVRTVRHNPSGAYVSGEARPRRIVGRFSDGTFLSVQQVLPTTPANEAGEVRTGSERYFLEDLDVGTAALIVEANGPEYSRQVIPGDPWPFWVLAPFAPAMAHAVVDSVLVLADSRGFDLEIWAPDARLVKTFAHPHEARLLTDELWEGELDRRLRALRERVESTGNRWNLNVEGELASIRRQFRAESRLPTVPAHGARMHADPEGNLWIQAWSDDQGERSTHWHIVLWGTGQLVGTVELPPRFRPTAIYLDAVLGVHTDELDVQTVREYRLDRGGA